MLSIGFQPVHLRFEQINSALLESSVASHYLHSAVSVLKTVLAAYYRGRKKNTLPLHSSKTISTVLASDSALAN